MKAVVKARAEPGLWLEEVPVPNVGGDDVLIRVSADAGGSRIDVRSKSRVGKGDLGTNAQRIRAYQKRLN